MYRIAPTSERIGASRRFRRKNPRRAGCWFNRLQEGSNQQPARAEPLTILKVASHFLLRLFIVAPDPAKGIGKDRSTMFWVVRSFATDELIVVPFECQALGHRLVC